MSLVDALKWFKHASFGVEDSNGRKYSFIDPYDLRGKEYRKADFVFITHAHYDHCSKEDFEKISGEKTKVIAPPDCLKKLGVPAENGVSVKPFDEKKIDEISFKAIPAYNVKKERLQFHPRENNWVGFVINLPEGKLFHAGDTDFIPEMKQLKDIGVALLPIGGTYTMNVGEAVQAANAINAKLTVPMHYKGILKEESEKAEKEFQEKVKGRTILLDEFQ